MKPFTTNGNDTARYLGTLKHDFYNKGVGGIYTVTIVLIRIDTVRLPVYGYRFSGERSRAELNINNSVSTCPFSIVSVYIVQPVLHGYHGSMRISRGYRSQYGQNVNSTRQPRRRHDMGASLQRSRPQGPEHRRYQLR